MSSFDRSWPVSGSEKDSIGCDAISTGDDHVRPLFRERDAKSVLSTLPSSRSSTRSKTASSEPFGRTTIAPDSSSAFGGGRSITTGGDQVAAWSLVRENSKRFASGKLKR